MGRARNHENGNQRDSKKMKQYLIAFGAAMALAGCATTPVTAENATPVPASKLIAFGTPPANGDYGTLIVTRDRGIIGSPCDTIIFIDGKEVGRIGAGETARFYIPASEFIIGAKPTAACAGGLKEREVKLVGGTTKHYRISIDTSMSMDLSPTIF